MENLFSLSSAVAPSRSAHWRLCALDAPGCFPFLCLTTCCAVHVCARSQRLSSDSSDYTLAQVKKSDHIELCACAAHFLNLFCGRVNRKLGLFSSVYVEHIHMAEKTQKLKCMWKSLEAHSHLAQSILAQVVARSHLAQSILAQVVVVLFHFDHSLRFVLALFSLFVPMLARRLSLSADHAADVIHS